MVDYKTQVIIVGGGLAGLGVAHGLGSRGVACVVLERGRLQGVPKHKDSDLRQTAVSYGSQQLMTGWGVWDEYLESAACEMTSICVRDGGDSAQVVFSAEKHGYERLGAIVANPLLRAGLARGLAQHSSVTVVEEATVRDIQYSVDGVEVVADIVSGKGTVSGYCAGCGFGSGGRALFGVSSKEGAWLLHV